ncbi:uncharacterized protein [Dermacentor albipictus]|uniref:uncharacterized protein n=1 Tax=Dermacentor albipictus TaxID=60249 RepID=UPI0031FCCFEC
MYMHKSSGNDACHGDDDDDAASPRLDLPAPPSAPAHESITGSSLEPLAYGGPEEMMPVMLRVLRVQLEDPYHASTWPAYGACESSSAACQQLGGTRGSRGSGRR